MPEQIRTEIARAVAGYPVQKEIVVHLPIGAGTFDVFDEERRVVGVVPEAIDITDRERAAEQIAQMHKMEAIGQLTGGVAHDLNNLLTPIVGALDMLRLKLAGDSCAERITTGALHQSSAARDGQGAVLPRQGLVRAGSRVWSCPLTVLYRLEPACIVTGRRLCASGLDRRLRARKTV